jgi:amino acid transporter
MVDATIRDDAHTVVHPPRSRDALRRRAAPMTSTRPTTDPPEKAMSLGGAIFLGVGAMVGAGIFALLGEAGAIAGSAVWISFLLGGAIAALLGYTLAKLSIRYPSRGGLVSFLHRGFGDSHLTGIASWLFYLAGLIVTAMVALSFGSYATSLFLPDDASASWVKVLGSAIVVAMALVNVIGAAAVGRLQSIIVVVLLVVFVVFIAVTWADADFGMLALSTYPSVSDIVAAVALTFFAYLGFAVIANTAESIPYPARNVPRATYAALAIAAGLYVLISVGVYGTLTVDEVIASGDTALAEAAEPSLGQAGYTMMAIAALLATASSVNANVFAAGGITANLAQTRQFPPLFGGPMPVLGTRGVGISVALVLLLANLFDLSTIASIGSAVALAIFALVGMAGMRLRSETGSNPFTLGAAIASTLVVLVLFSIDTARNEPRTFVAIVVIGALTVVLDFLWKRQRGPLAPDLDPSAPAPQPS